MTPDEIRQLMAEPPAPPPAAPQAAPPPASGSMTPDEIRALMAEPEPSAAPPPPAELQPVAPADAGRGLSPEEVRAFASTPAPAAAQPSGAPAVDEYGRPLEGAFAPDIKTDPSGQVAASVVTGAAKSIYETKDFIFGKTAEEDKSPTRRALEGLDRELAQESIANSFVSGLSQFATGMLGAGKLVGLAKAVPAVGGAVGALEASRKGALALETAKAAAVGAVAFDPNGPRLSDLIVSKGPSWLQNPVNSYLAGDPNDSAAIGRAKNALESIGVDVALAGVFAASLKGFALVQARKAGTATPEAADAALSELGTAVAHQEAKLAVSKGDTAAVEALREAHPQAVADAERRLLWSVRRSHPPMPLRPTPCRLGAPGGPWRSGRRPARRWTTGRMPPPCQPRRSVTPRVSALPGEVLPGARTGEGGLTGTVPAQAEPSGLQLLGITDDQVSRLIAHGRADTEQLLSPVAGTAPSSAATGSAMVAASRGRSSASSPATSPAARPSIRSSAGSPTSSPGRSQRPRAGTRTACSRTPWRTAWWRSGWPSMATIRPS